MDSINMIFIVGDADAGLVVTGRGDTEYSFQYEGENIRAEVKTQLLNLPVDQQIVIQTLNLELEKPLRFRIEWLIPENTQNAAMTLNGNLLISPMAPAWPADGPVLPLPECGNETPVSTLHAGQFQSLSFIWQDGDSLSLYLVEK